MKLFGIDLSTKNIGFEYGEQKYVVEYRRVPFHEIQDVRILTASKSNRMEILHDCHAENIWACPARGQTIPLLLEHILNRALYRVRKKLDNPISNRGEKRRMLGKHI